MARKNENVLTSEFLAELYNCAITNNQICSVVVRYMEDSFLPDQQYQMLNATLKSYYNEYKCAPQYGIITQRLSASRAVSELLEEIRDVASNPDADSIRDQFEEYLKLVQFKKIFKDVSKKYEDGARFDAMSSFIEESTRLQQFSLKPEELVDVARTFEERLRENKLKMEQPKDQPVNNWFIDGLNDVNQGANLRGQLSLILASSGVGKSHIARWIGWNSAYVAGLDVLHIQLEGSQSECMDAYSAMFTQTSVRDYESGKINQHALEQFRKTLDTYKGMLCVKSYPRFNKEVSVSDVMNECEKFKMKYGRYPSVLIIDSLDLLTDASGRSYDSKNLRFKRLSTAQNLKDMASMIGAWIVATYQATVESADFLNDESKVLGTYNLSECKGLARPCTHLISLNMSRREYQENTMRIHIEKYRFAKKCEPFRIATDYAHEVFYDRVRTLNLSTQ